jgi:hypothetical protein
VWGWGRCQHQYQHQGRALEVGTPALDSP